MNATAQQKTCLERFASYAERRIAEKLIADALAAGYFASVWEGEDWAIKLSQDRAAILAALASTDSDQITFHRERTKEGRLGWVLLIWGNGTDLISDHTDNEAICALVAGAEKLAETLAS